MAKTFYDYFELSKISNSKYDLKDKSQYILQTNYDHEKLENTRNKLGMQMKEILKNHYNSYITKTNIYAADAQIKNELEKKKIKIKNSGSKYNYNNGENEKIESEKVETNNKASNENQNISMKENNPSKLKKFFKGDSFSKIFHRDFISNEYINNIKFSFDEENFKNNLNKVYNIDIIHREELDTIQNKENYLETKQINNTYDNNNMIKNNNKVDDNNFNKRINNNNESINNKNERKKYENKGKNNIAANNYNNKDKNNKGNTINENKNEK